MILNLICKINFKSGACDFSTENESHLELENNSFDELNSFSNIEENSFNNTGDTDELFDPDFLLPFNNEEFNCYTQSSLNENVIIDDEIKTVGDEMKIDDENKKTKVKNRKRKHEDCFYRIRLNNNKYMKYSFKINHTFQSNYDDQTRENIRNYNKYISLIKKNNFLKFHEFKKDECLKIFKCYNKNPIDFEEIVTKIISRVLTIKDKKFYKEL
ncbi:hypothetical protein HERIO_1331 [Hepatospora eriocheir]|uniref:Uncharacterized protein n=1 Tax=Hepatospora eriocheir TaxID=1081669 RepID=A0A1X0QAE7_9MICR|nr:hypothetical protein HERIO_1331 [Hepatospora eriocheir]